MEETDPKDMTPEERAKARATERAAMLAAAASLGARGPFRWHPVARSFIDAADRVVKDRVVRAAFDTALEKSARDVTSFTQQLRDGEVSLPEWQRAMEREVKNVHTTAGALARGGFDELSPDDLRFVQDEVRRELGYLQSRAEAIASGEQALDGTLLRRAEMYTKAGRKTYHKMHRLQMQKIGYNQERNVLGVAEHCDQCVALAARELVPNGSIPAVGERQCLNQFACGIEYRRTRETDPSDFPSIKGTPEAASPEVLRPRVRE